MCIKGDYVYIAELGELLFIDNVLYQPGTRHHHSQVRVFDKQGNEVSQIGTKDSGAAGSFFTAHGICLDHEDNILVGEVGIPYGDIWTVYPEGKGMSSGFHPFLQKFRRIK